MKTFLEQIAFPTALLAIVAFLCRSIIAHWLNKDVERFKDQLKTEQEAYLRQIQHSFDLAKLEHQIRFARLYEKKFSKIEDLQTDVRALLDALVNALRVDRSTQAERITEALGRRRAVHEKLKLFEVFLPDKFVSEWDAELDRVCLALTDLSIATSDPDRTLQPDLRLAVDKLAASLRRMNGELIIQAREILEPA